MREFVSNCLHFEYMEYSRDVGKLNPYKEIVCSVCLQSVHTRLLLFALFAICRSSFVRYGYTRLYIINVPKFISSFPVFTPQIKYFTITGCT